MSLYQIVLRLARNPGFPAGDDHQGYTMVAPLDDSDRLDPREWRDHRDLCSVIRFKPGEEKNAEGRLSHNGANWFFHYDDPQGSDDEAAYRLGEHRLAIGDYVTIHEDDGKSQTYRVSQRTPYPSHKSSTSHRKESAE